MLRRILAVATGIVVAMAVVVAVEALGSLVFRPPPGMDPTNADSVRANMPNVAVGALLVVLLAWALGGLAGSYVVARLVSAREALLGFIVGGFVLAGGLAALLQYSHPVWFIVAGPLAVIGATVLGVRLGSARTA